MLKLARYLKHYKKEVILGPIFKLVEAIFELIIPLVMANMIDVGVKNADRAYVLQMGGVMVLLAATGLACALICQYFAAKTSQGFGTELRNKLFAHIGALSHAEIDRFGTHSLVTRMTNDINQLQVAVAMMIRLAIRAPFLVIGATVMAMVIDFRMALIFVAAAGLIAVALYLIMSKSVPFYRTVQKLLDRVSLKTRENLAGVRVIRAFSRQESEQEQFRMASDELKDTSVRVGRIAALLNPVTYLIVNLGIVAVLWFGGGNVDTGYLEQGQMIALVQYMTQIMLALVVVANLVILFTKAGASGARVLEVLETEPSIREGTAEHGKDGRGGKTPRVEFEHVYFSYGGTDRYALADINLKMMRGETVGVIGGTGAGKSTLVDLIPRFYDAGRGVVRVDGRDVREYALTMLRKEVGIVPQRALLFSGTVRDNMRWADDAATDGEIDRALRVAQAAAFVDAFPEGLDHWIEQGGKNLSGGQRQRLTIARALVGAPQILILDDSASALDFATDAALRAALREYSRDMTVVMVSQRAATLKHADQIVVMDEGQVAGVGTHSRLFETNEIYREICLSQLSGKEAEA